MRAEARRLWALWKATPDELALRLSLWVWHVKERDGQSPDPGLDARIKKLQGEVRAAPCPNACSVGYYCAGHSAACSVVADCALPPQKLDALT